MGIISILLTMEEFFAQYHIHMGRKLLTSSSTVGKYHQAVCVQSDRHRISWLCGCEAVRQSFRRSPGQWARRHCVALGISHHSVRIVHTALDFKPHKMVLVQELSVHDMAVAQHLIGILSDDVISLWQMKHTSTYLAVSIDRIFAIGQRNIHSSSINGLFTVHVSAVKWQSSEL